MINPDDRAGRRSELVAPTPPPTDTLARSARPPDPASDMRRARTEARNLLDQESMSLTQQILTRSNLSYCVFSAGALATDPDNA
jgi:hypothetical protein